MSRPQHSRESSELEDLNFLRAFAVHNISSDLTLEEEERAANALLHAAYAKSKKYQDEHSYALPDHLEQFRREYEKTDHKAKGRIPMVSTLSPRTRREVSLLPPPNAFEERKIEKLVELSKKTDKSSLYGQLAHHEPVGDQPRLTDIVNSHMVLIPHNAVKDVQKDSTHYFETMEHAKRRKQEQDARLARLFDKYKYDDHEEATKKSTKASGVQRVGTAPRSASQGKRALPKLASVTTPLTDGIPGDAPPPVGGAQAASASSIAAPSSSSGPRKPGSSNGSRGAQSRLATAGSFSLSRSLTALTTPQARAAATTAATRTAAHSSTTSAAMPTRPATMERRRAASPPKTAPSSTALVVAGSPDMAFVAAAQSQESETLAREQTPLLYSLFKANPLLGTGTERGVRYSQTAMQQLISERCQHESERLARIKAKLDDRSETEYLNLFSVKVLDEIGLDLNKEYNRLRNFTIYLMQLSYHFYMQRMRAGFAHFHAQYARIREARLKRAKNVIFRSVKLGVHLLTQNERKRRKEQQDRADELRRLAADAEFRRKCLIVFRALFYHKQMKAIRKRVRHRKMATQIQRRVRGMIGRRIARAWRTLRARLSAASLVIQCAYRQRLARRKVTLARKLHHVQMLLDELRRFRESCAQQMYLDGAEATIARAYRALVLRRKLQNLLYWNRYRCAVVIQRIYTGYRVRQKFQKIWSLYQERVAEENACALRIQLLVRAYLARRALKARAQRKLRLARERRARKLMLFATTSQFNLQWVFVRLYRKMKPFRIHMLRKRATVIQRVWRGHRGRKRAFFVRVARAIKAINDVHHRRVKAVGLMQRNWRGFITRLKLERARRQRLAVRIQTLWRLIYAKKRVWRLRKLQVDARTLTRRLHRLYKKHKFHIKYLWQQQRAPFAVRIQALMRGAVTRMRHARMLSVRRQDFETKRFINTRLNQLLAATQLQLIRDSMSVPIGHKTHAFSGDSCTCLGPVQALFTLGACHRGRTDPIALVTNKSDAITLLKLLNKVKGLIDRPEKPGTTITATTVTTATVTVTVTDASSSLLGPGQQMGPPAAQATKKKVKRANPIIENLCMFQEYDAGRITLPAVLRKLKPNHIDILFNRAKTETGNLLSYDDFVNCLRLIAEAHYAKTDETETIEDTGVAVTGTVTSATVAPTNEASHSSAAEPHNHKRKLDRAVHHFHQAGHKRRVHQISLARLKCNPQELFHGPQPDFRMALVLNAFASLRQEEFMAPVLEWVHREACARIDVFVVRIQAVMRRHLSKKVISVRTKARDEQRLATKLWHQATKVQSLARMFVQRFRLARDAQRTIIQYVPHFGEPYWYHPRTKVKSWTKPKVLRSLDAYSIALPEEGLENVINCTYCSRPAEVNCADCEDSMCRICYDSMHCKGARARHRSFKIPSCAYCKFQVATKSCLTCIITPPSKGNIRESVPEAYRGSYCDTCFVHEHDANCKAMRIHKQRRKDIKNILDFSSQAYLVDQYLRQRIITNHHYENLVQSCEECGTRASTWRCQDCNQVYCSSCLVGLHSMGGPFARHKAEQLPYFTPEMHVSFKKDINRQLFQQKMEKVCRAERARREERHRQCAIQIQAWWRMIYHGYRGRKELRRRRRRLRLTYKAHKRDTLERRNTFTYRVQDLFGWAPPLPSDTHEEAALRTLNVFRREAARTFIDENVDDWGHYRTSRVHPRKGTPKVGFAVGTEEELIEQAQRGGYRLPGRVMVVPGEHMFTTTCDLTRLLRPGEYVRIRNRIFGVVRVSAATIRVNRYWRAGTEADRPADEGELIFRAPMYLGEPRRWEYRRRYLSYAALVENPVSQFGVGAYRLYASQMMRFALYMVRSNRRNGLKEEEQAWRAAAAQYADNIRYADSLFITGDQIRSLYGTTRVKIPPLVMQEDALTRSMKKGKSSKGAVETLNALQRDGHRVVHDDGFGDDELIAEDASGSQDSWGEPRADAVRPKSALKRGPSLKKVNRVVPAEHSPRAEGGDLVSLLTVEEGEHDDDVGMLGEFNGEEQSLQSEVSSRSKRSGGVLSIISNKLYNREEAEAVKAAADALHELDKADLPKAAGDVAAVLAEKKRIKEEKRKKKLEKPKEPWYATPEQLDARAEREDRMTALELAAEADDWKECVDVMTENIYWENVKTLELFTTMPRAVAAKRQLEFENSKNKKNYDDAQKRIQKIEQMLKNRKLITGGVHK